MSVKAAQFRFSYSVYLLSLTQCECGCGLSWTALCQMAHVAVFVPAIIAVHLLAVLWIFGARIARFLRGKGPHRSSPSPRQKRTANRKGHNRRRNNKAAQQTVKPSACSTAAPVPALVWRNISYSVASGGSKDAQLLKNVSI